MISPVSLGLMVYLRLSGCNDLKLGDDYEKKNLIAYDDLVAAISQSLQSNEVFYDYFVDPLAMPEESRLSLAQRERLATDLIAVVEKYGCKITRYDRETIKESLGDISAAGVSNETIGKIDAALQLPVLQISGVIGGRAASAAGVPNNAPSVVDACKQ